ncbi:protein amalgam [Eurytemora carolleeae]|uniref:protein amalgam n=1 Tax=Eurytemora carolleeae TaxID=1294199 RepID=UPI000C77CFA4|nr:protein amalgam [Eurytemora carolleeae]|eukprot:XP_023343155.1 protein amalgam-like [Eurytemora affinis]
MKRKISLNKNREIEKPSSTMVLLPLFVTLSLIDVVCMETLVKPRILTSPQIYRAKAGESIELECSVHNLGTMVLLWKEGPRVLFAGTMRVRRDERMELRGTNLILHGVEKSDEGEYDCEIETDRSDPISIRHSIEILIPPSVRSDPANGEVLVKQGSMVTVQCTATGNPSPSVTWTRLNQDKILGEGGVLQLSDVTHHHAGMYICTADNGVGNPADVHIQIKVLYKPEVWVEQDVVQGGLGEQATLVCRVQGYPIPDIRWYRGTMLLETDNHSV